MNLFINICQTLGVIGAAMCLVVYTAVETWGVKVSDSVERFSTAALVFLFGGFGLAFIAWLWT